MKNAVLQVVPPIKIKVSTPFTEAMNSEYSKEQLKIMEFELESINVDEVAVLTSVSNICRNQVIGVIWVFREKIWWVS